MLQAWGAEGKPGSKRMFPSPNEGRARTEGRWPAKKQSRAGRRGHITEEHLGKEEGHSKPEEEKGFGEGK